MPKEAPKEAKSEMRVLGTLTGDFGEAFPTPLGVDAPELPGVGLEGTGTVGAWSGTELEGFGFSLF